MTADPDTPNRQRSPDLFRDFTAHVSGLLRDGGTRAELRPALRQGPDKAHGANRYLALWLDDEGAEFSDRARRDTTRNALLTTAGLMAQFPSAATLDDTWAAHRKQPSSERVDRRPRLDLGLALAELDRAKSKRPGKPGGTPTAMSSREVRLMQLCRTDQARLPRHLFSALSLIKSGQQRLPSWAQIAEDIELHARQPDRVARYWQNSFLTRPPWRR